MRRSFKNEMRAALNAFKAFICPIEINSIRRTCKNMENYLSNLTFFKDLSNREKVILCKTIAKIFTKRFLRTDSFKVFLKDGESPHRIERGLPENFTIPGPSYMPFGWIADEKFKVFTSDGSDEIPNIRYTAVWLDIRVGKDAIFEKAKVDIMNFVSRRPDDLVFSCLIYPDDAQAKINLQLYRLQPDIGWKCITTFSYSSSQDFTHLSPFERGQIGESLGTIFAERFLYSERSRLFPNIENENLYIEECLFSRGNENFSHPSNSWVPDATFQVFSNPSPIELIYEFTPKKTAYIEVKTGKNAKFERWQKEDIIRYSKSPNSIVLFCEVLPDPSTHTLRLNMKRRFDEKWKTIQTYYYSDFSGSSVKLSE